MSIRRRKKTQHFTQINNSAALHPGLSLKAKGLLLVMMTRPEDWVFYMDWLQKQSKDGREAHQNALKELEAHRYVIRLRVQRENGTFQGWEYLVDDEPITDIDPGGTVIREDAGDAFQPTNGKPVYRLPDPPTDERENRLTGKPIDGKPATTNTELTKKEKHQEEVIDLTGNARAHEPGHDDFATPAEPNSTPQPSDGPAPAQKAVPLEVDFDPDPRNPDDFAGLFDDEPSEQATSEITSSKEVPGGGEKNHKLQKWDPADTHTEIDRFCNGAWLRGRSGKPAWVTEVDASGVDRRTIGEVLDPAFVTQVATRIRKERTAKLNQAGRGEGVASFQHLLIQELQRLTLSAEQVRGLIEAAAQGAESLEEGPRAADPAQSLLSTPLTLRTLSQRRQWQVGDVVSYRRDRYEIVALDERKISLDSDECGSVDIIRATDEVKALRLVSAAMNAHGVSA